MAETSSFLIQSFSGLSDFEDKGSRGAFKFGSGLDVRRRRDTLKAGQALANDLALGGLMNSPVVDGFCASDGNFYCGLENGRILKRTSAGVWSLVYTDVEGDLRGIGEWGNDNGEKGIYWATPTKLHRHKIGGNWTTDIDANAGDPAQTYPKTNLTNTPNHLMKVVNGVFLINNGETLAMVGYDESYTNNALQLLPDSLAEVLLDDGLYAIVGANFGSDKEESWLYSWDGISQNYNDRTPLAFKDIHGIIKTEIIIVQFGDDGFLYFIGDSARIPVMQIPGGGRCKPSGTEVDNGLALLGIYGTDETRQSGVYSYGRKKKNGSFALNLEYPLVCDSIDMVRKVGSDILIAYKSGSQYGVKKVDTTTKVARAVYETVDLKMPPVVGQHSVPYVVLDMVPLPSGCSVEVWRRMDKDETADGKDYEGVSTGLNDGWSQCALQGGEGLYNSAGGKEAVFNIGDGGKYLELRVVLNCSGNNSPEVLRIYPAFEDGN